MAREFEVFLQVGSGLRDGVSVNKMHLFMCGDVTEVTFLQPSLQRGTIAHTDEKGIFRLQIFGTQGLTVRQRNHGVPRKKRRARWIPIRAFAWASQNYPQPHWSARSRKPWLA
jgi:hypothetical protein